MSSTGGQGIFGLLWMLLLFAAAGAGAERQFEAGTGHSYRLESTVLLNEEGGGRLGKDVGFQVSAGVIVSSVWQDNDNPASKLLQIELKSPQLHIKSRKAPAPEGFVKHASKLESLQNGPYLIHWVGGTINHIFIAQGEDLSMVNLKKGVASLFQYKILDVETTEKDASGKCKVKYTSTDPRTILKTKSDCVSGKTVPFIMHPDRVLSTLVTSKRSMKYVLSKDLSVLESVTSAEAHEMTVILYQDAGSSVKASQELKLTADKVKVSPVKAGSVEQAVKEMEKRTKLTFNKQILVTDREQQICQDECPTLAKLVKENQEYLSDEHLGSLRSATAFTKLLSAVRSSKKEEIAKVLKSSKNKEIILQLCDLVGAAQTQAAHEAAMKVLHLEAEGDLNQNERYFQALSFGSHPIPLVIKDVLKRSEKLSSNEKLQETMILSASAMANRLRKLPAYKDHKVVDEVKTSLLSSLEACKTEQCKQMYLRALKNLGLQETVPTLLKYALTGTKKTSVAAMKALRSLPVEYWDDSVKKAAHRIYYQLDKRYDSSARTLAIDILLESDPSQETLNDLILSLVSNDPAYEVKQYLMQRVRQISERDQSFGATVREIFRKENVTLNNYNIAALRGLSTAFTRSFLSNPSSNGSLVTVQEISSGLLKRGTVDIVVENSGEEHTLFSLGLFAGGLGSFISSDESSETADPNEPEESATAGMELSVLGVQIRPYVFFNGQGELMGHVWSGTASERTPAFQTIALLHDHLQYIPLQTGFIAEISLYGTLSFDLSGQIQLSLWNRNANSLVEKSAGLLLQGLLKVDTSFVRSQIEFNVATEANLSLVSDIDFYNNIALCLQLQQPNSVLKHNIHKVERIPGSKHRLRKSKYKVLHIPGKTYALNRKNNEMCTVIFSK
ncbi:microsomal triacylglycerol transfer protein isoform X2 [Anabrus simplex]|uniref:microsomal triacylglycerol transfer protein isoform X2 n=1 Tax=Anabrus simplex TaxID=316456 RepID=UPI0035A363CF